MAVDQVLARERAGEILATTEFHEALVEVLQESPEFALGVPGSTGSLTPSEIEVLEEGGLRVPERGPLQPIVRTVLIYGQLMAGSLTTTEAAQLLHVDGARIRQRLAERTIFGVKGHSGEWRVPKFQFAAEGLVPNLGQVLRALPSDLHPVEVFNWLTLPEPELELEGEEVSPLSWLMSGGSPQPAVEIAEHVGQSL